jgi:hypothetical protein
MITPQSRPRRTRLPTPRDGRAREERRTFSPPLSRLVPSRMADGQCSCSARRRRRSLRLRRPSARMGRAKMGIVCSCEVLLSTFLVVFLVIMQWNIPARLFQGGTFEFFVLMAALQGTRSLSSQPPGSVAVVTFAFTPCCLVIALLGQFIFLALISTSQCEDPSPPGAMLIWYYS